VFLDVPAPVNADLPVPADVADRLAGDYKVGAFRFGFEALGLAVKDGHAALTIGGLNSGGPTLPLRYQGDGRFVSAVDSEHLMVFTTQPDGSVKLDMHYYDGVIGAVKAKS